MQKFIVFNQSCGRVSFRLALPTEDLSRLAQHHKRKVVRSSFSDINLARSCSIDLVKETGLTIEQLLCQNDLNVLISKATLRVLCKDFGLGPVFVPPMVDLLPEVEEVFEEDPVLPDMSSELEENPIVDDSEIDEPIVYVHKDFLTVEDVPKIPSSFVPSSGNLCVDSKPKKNYFGKKKKG
jgi:hypothetical protein